MSKFHKLLSFLNLCDFGSIKQMELENFSRFVDDEHLELKLGRVLVGKRQQVSTFRVSLSLQLSRMLHERVNYPVFVVAVTTLHAQSPTYDQLIESSFADA